MICPACKEPLIALEHESIEVDYCAGCRGVWLDAGELELLFGDASACATFLEGGAPLTADEARRRCPLCRRHMEKRRTEGDKPVTFDHCPRGHGLWLDNGELAAILAHGHAHDDQERAARFLREVFPIKASTGA